MLCKISPLVLLCGMASACMADDIDVYIAAGQSNMDGRASTSDLPSNSSFRSSQSNAIIWYSNPGEPGTNEADFSSNGWQTLRPGFSVEPGFSGSLPSSTFGPEISFAGAIRDETGSRNDIGIIKISKGGTSIRESRGEWHGNPNDNPGYLHDELISEVNRALSALANRGDRGIIRGMIWHQGEADRSFRFYISNLEELIDSVRDEFGSNLPIVVGELSRDRSDNSTFNNNLDDFVDDASNLGLVRSSGLDTDDDTHFDADSQIDLGERYADVLGSMVGTIGSGGGGGPGGIVFTLTESSSGGVNIVASGSGVIPRAADPNGGRFSNGGNGEDDYDYTNFNTDYLRDDRVGTGNLRANSNSGFIRNLTTGITYDIEDVNFDRDSGNRDDLDIDTRDNAVFNEGDEWQFSYTGQFNSSRLEFDDLIVGTHVINADTGATNSAGFAEEIFGDITIRVIR